MLPFPSDRRPRRFAQLLLGLVLFGAGVALMVQANLGLSPWMVFHQGVSVRSGLSIGTITVLTGLGVLLLWIPLRERWGVGTVLNVMVIGPVLDGALAVIPEASGPIGWLFMLGGVVTVGLGSGLYIGAAMGPGPRDGVMTGLARRGISVRAARTIIEVSVVVLGFLLGGSVGAGTLAFAVGIGPSVQFFLRRFDLR
ncbi:MAG: hypothetical protein HKN46_00275 [Acidimicrobiia bacterium]|nr:hypothetical protein [Acidimicrobiia bacterium]